MKVLAIISLAIAIGVASYEATMWLGKSDLAVVITAIAVAIILQSSYALVKKQGFSASYLSQVRHGKRKPSHKVLSKKQEVATEGFEPTTKGL